MPTRQVITQPQFNAMTPELRLAIVKSDANRAALLNTVYQCDPHGANGPFANYTDAQMLDLAEAHYIMDGELVRIIYKLAVKVTDRRGKYPSKTYQVEVSSPDNEELTSWEQEMTAYGIACEQFIKDNNHPPRGPAQRSSSYYSRFWNEVVAS
jgi:hypothetical protein